MLCKVQDVPMKISKRSIGNIVNFLWKFEKLSMLRHSFPLHANRYGETCEERFSPFLSPLHTGIQEINDA